LRAPVDGPGPGREALDRMVRDHPPERRLDLVVERGREAGLLPRDLPAERFRSLYRLFRAHLRAFHRYRPDPYAGPVLFLRATGRPEGRPALLKPWRRLAEGGLSVLEVPGDHHSVLRPPGVRALAETLGATLGRLAETTRGGQAHG
ncbi:MAG: hypothetical protein ACLF0P_04830, partial [Thermoanaerobaculia bacterium]